MKSITSDPINRLSNGILQAIDWVADARQQSTRLNREADRLIIRLRRCYNRATQLDNATHRSVAIGLYGHDTAAKIHLFQALAPGAKLLTGDAALTVRYCSSDVENSPAYPVAICLLDEAQLIAMAVGAAFMEGFRPDWNARAITAYLHGLERHRHSYFLDRSSRAGGRHAPSR
ncbi:virulence factor SrfC family protein [Serratia symbiotica]|uniref:virulence factor SrfC family protein n=1 Tax=Serratia symbiotica TaxID=138074 RepID=UPI00077C09D6|nr:virulence factor SrfC family protein [Serratia symbiotica]